MPNNAFLDFLEEYENELEKEQNKNPETEPELATTTRAQETTNTIAQANNAPTSTHQKTTNNQTKNNFAKKPNQAQKPAQKSHSQNKNTSKKQENPFLQTQPTAPSQKTKNPNVKVNRNTQTINHDTTMPNERDNDDYFVSNLLDNIASLAKENTKEPLEPGDYDSSGNVKKSVDITEWLAAREKEQEAKKRGELVTRVEDTPLSGGISGVFVDHPEFVDKIVVESMMEVIGEEKDSSVSEEEEASFSNKGSGEDPEARMFRLLEETETFYPNEWVEAYQKALKSRKSNIVVEKVRSGRFRINSDHQIELLSEFKTNGKKSNDLLREKWKLG